MATIAKRIITVFFAITLLLTYFTTITAMTPAPIQAIASEPTDKVVVFVIDSSGSMQINDPDRLAIDSIAQLIYSLPSDYNVAVASYNDEVVLQTELSPTSARATLVREATDIAYNGYTSAGKGLQTAVDLLEGSSAIQKDIVILSDGEILLGNQEKTQAEIELFNMQVESAKAMGARIHVIGLGAEMEDTDSTIFSGADDTGGSKHHAPKALDIQKAIDEILLNKLGIKKSTLGTIESNGEAQNIKVALPAKNMSRVRILLTSTLPITNLVADFGAENSLQDSGKRYALIELDYPTRESINISVDSEKGSKIKVELIPEYSVTAKTEIAYIDSEPTNDKAETYNRTAEITFSFIDANSPNKRLFEESYFNGEEIICTINGEKISLKLENGQAAWQTAVAKDDILQVKFDYTSLPVNVLNAQEPVAAALAAPPVFERPDYTPYIIAAIVLLILIIAVIVIIAIIVHKRKQQPVAVEAPEPSKYYYTGKLNIYITRTKSDIDIAPLTFNLFRLSSGRAISLFEILRELDIDESFEGAEKIFFKPSAKRKIILNNQSDCTVMKSREILLKNKSLELDVDSKVDITFEDELGEAMIQYKDVT